MTVTKRNQDFTHPSNKFPSSLALTKDARKANLLLLRPRPIQRLLYPTVDAPTLSFVSAPTNSQILTTTPIFTGSPPNYQDVIANGQVSLFGACNPQHVGSYPGTITYKNICKQVDSLGTNQIYCYSLHFYSDSDKVELISVNTGPGAYRVWIDDQVVNSLIPTTFASTGVGQSLMITNTSAKTRRYRVDMSSSDFVGMFVSAGRSIWAAEQRGPTVFFFGDSILGGSGNSTSGCSQIPQYLGDVYGWDNVWNLAQGGTGYNVKNAPSSADNTAYQQVLYNAPSLAAPSTTVPGTSMPTPDVVVMGWGHNDASPWSTTAQTNALNTVALARKQWPKAFIVLLGPFFGGAIGTQLNTSETALFAAAAPYVDGMISSLQGTNRPWLTGSGYTAAPTGTGNGDFYIGTDGVHPTDAGIAYLAERIDPELRKLLS